METARQNKTGDAEKGKRSKQLEGGYDRLVSKVNSAKEGVSESECSSTEMI